VQASGRQPQRAPDGAPSHCERHRPEQTTLYWLVRKRAATLFAEAGKRWLSSVSSELHILRISSCAPAPNATDSVAPARWSGCL